MPDECPEVSGCSCETNPFSYVASGAPDNDVIEEITEQLSGLRWELPCLDSSGICACDAETSDSTVLVGDPDRTYQVQLRFRGFVEMHTYVGGIGDGYFQTGGSPAAGTFNIYSLEISSPPQTYYLNRSHPGHTNPAAIDYNAVVPMDGGATVTLRSQSVDNQQIANSGNVVVPGVPPDPDPYDGQFIQMDVVEIT